MSLARASLFTATSIACKVTAGVVLIKLLAVRFGPEGMGRAANYMTLLTVLGVLSGAGIFHGVTRYVATYQHDADRRRALLGAASGMALGASALIGATLLVLAAPLGRFIFAGDGHPGVLRVVAIVQIGIAATNLLLAILRGYRDVKGHACCVIAGAVLGLIAYIVCAELFGYEGALVGLALAPAAALLPAALRLSSAWAVPPSALLPSYDRARVLELSTFALMSAVTATTLPLAYMLLRNQLAARHGLRDVGLWQGVGKISDAYLQLVTAGFSVYLLPTLSRLRDKAELAREISRALRFVMPAVSAVSLTVYLLRHVAIRLLFSADFAGMSPLFAWQLGGDVFKAGAYVFGYLIIARGALRLYVIAELTQLALLVGSALTLMPSRGALGAAQAYLFTYVVYFALCLLGFEAHQRRA